MNIFTSKKTFVLADALASHAQLLLRSYEVTDHGGNEDILFFGCRYLAIPVVLKELVISEVKPEDCPDEFAVSQSAGSKIFALSTADGVYHIVASQVAVYVNQLPQNETALGTTGYNVKGREQVIASSSGSESLPGFEPEDTARISDLFTRVSKSLGIAFESPYIDENNSSIKALGIFPGTGLGRSLVVDLAYSSQPLNYQLLDTIQGKHDFILLDPQNFEETEEGVKNILRNRATC